MTVDYDEQKVYWEGKKSRRHPTHRAVEAFATSKTSIVREHVNPTGEPMTMLEVGAGNGYFSEYLRRDFDLTSLDFSSTMLSMNPLPDDQKVVGDAEDLPYPDDSFDVVFCGNLLHHLEDPIVAVREMRRVARRHVVLVEPNSINPLMFAFGVLKKEERGSIKFTPQYLIRLGLSAPLSLRYFTSQGAVLPNKTPLPLVPFVRLLETENTFGFYHIAIFDV